MKCLLSFALLFCFASAMGSVAKAAPNSGTSTAKDATEAEASACAPVMVGGVEIICFDQGIGSFSASERAAAIQERIEKLSRDRTFDAGRLGVIATDHVYNIMAGDLFLASLHEGDVKGAKGQELAAVAQQVVDRAQTAITVDRQQRTPTTLIWALTYSLIATLCLIIFLVGLQWLYPRLYARIKQSRGKSIRTLKIQSFEILNEQRIVGFLGMLARASRVILTLIALYIYIPLVLSFFPWTANWAPKLFGYIMDPLLTILHVVVNYIPKLFFILMIFLVTRYLLKLIRFFFKEIEYGSLYFSGFHREWAEPTYKLVRFLVIAFALVMAFPYLPGARSPAFQGISVFLGILLSFGSSSAVGNIVAGVVLTYMRPFKVGDRVKIADTVGDVIEKTLLVTRIRTIKNVDITVPNSMVLGSHMVNYSSIVESEQGLILNTTVTIGYDAPWRQVHELLKSAALRTEGVDAARAPFVLQTALSDFYVAYELNAYTKQPNRMALIYSDLHQNIQDCFNEAGVEIMSPHYSSLRDGNEVAIPASYRKEGYEAPSFRVEKKD